MKHRRPLRLRGSTRGILIFLCAVLLLVAGIFTYLHLRTPADTGYLEILFVDVGQGDSALLSHRDGNVLIDTGTTESGAVIGNVLREHGGYLNCLVLTHPHSDHTGGAAYIIENFRIDTVILPENMEESDPIVKAIRQKNISTAILTPGEAFRIGELQFTCLAPLSEHNWENDNSYVLRLDYGEVSALFTGDAESASEATQLAVYGAAPGGFLDVDLLKAGHHGSSTSSTDLYLAAVTPEYAVISCGVDNAYGHPHKEAISHLMECGARILRTDLSGTVVFRTDGKILELIP